MANSEKHIADGDFLLSLIPQKKPFVMVHTLQEFSKKKLLSTLKVLPDNILVQENHLTASGLIENMAQTVALHTGYKYYLMKKPAPTGYIGAIKKAEVLHLPKINQELITTVEILHDIMDVTLVKAHVECDGTIIASSEMKTALAK